MVGSLLMGCLPIIKMLSARMLLLLLGLVVCLGSLQPLLKNIEASLSRLIQLYMVLALARGPIEEDRRQLKELWDILENLLNLLEISNSLYMAGKTYILKNIHN